MKKISCLPAPTDPLVLKFGGPFETCNNNPDFKKDKKINKNFHTNFLKNNNCTLPYLGGTKINHERHTFCNKRTTYDQTLSVYLNFFKLYSKNFFFSKPAA